MPPTPTPTAEQVETTREAARLLSLTYTETLINRLTDEQWVRMLATLTEWEDARHDDVKILGRVLIEPEKQRQLLTDEVRERLGLPPLFSSEITQQGDMVSGSTPTRVEI